MNESNPEKELYTQRKNEALARESEPIRSELEENKQVLEYFNESFKYLERRIADIQVKQIAIGISSEELELLRDLQKQYESLTLSSEPTIARHRELVEQFKALSKKYGFLEAGDFSKN